MAVLTWQNVNAPQGSSGIEGLGMAARLLAGAGNGVSDALGTYGQAQTTLANNAFAQAASQYQDPDSLKAALASGALNNAVSAQGFNPSRVDAGTIGTQDTRVGNLITNATNQQALNQSQYNYNLAKNQNDNLIAAEPAVAALTAAGSDPTKQAAVYADPTYGPLLSKLTPDQQFGIQSKAATNGSENLKLLQASRGDQYDQASQAAFANITQNPTDALGAQAKLQALNLPAPVYLATRAKLTAAGYMDPTNPANAGAVGMGGGIPMTVPGLPGAGGASAAIAGAAGHAASADGASGFDTIYGNGKYAQPPSPVTTMPISSVLDWQKNSLIPATQGQLKDGQGNVLKGSDGKPLGTSAVGAYQLTDQTISNYGPKVLGADWQSQNLGPQQQDKIAEAAFNDNKNGNLHAIWPTLPSSTPGAYKNMSWNDMRQQIAQPESGTSGLSLMQQLNNAQIGNTVTQAGIATKNQQNITALKIDPVAWDAATKDTTTSPTAMAKTLIADPKSVFYQSNVNSVQNMLTQAQAEYQKQAVGKDGKPTGNNLNLAQLGLLIGNNLDSGFSGKLAAPLNVGHSWISNTLNDGQTVNSGGLHDSIQNALQGFPAAAAGAQVDLGQRSQFLDSATQLYQKAYQDWATMANMSRVMHVDPDALARKEAIMNRAKSMYESAQANVRTPPPNSPPGTPPAGVPLGQSTAQANVAAALAAASAPPKVLDANAQAAALAQAVRAEKYQ